MTGLQYSETLFAAGVKKDFTRNFTRISSRNIRFLGYERLNKY